MDAKRSPLRATIVRPDPALPIQPFDLAMKVLLTTEAAGGAISLVMGCHEPGEGPPDRIHFNREEMFFVVEGIYELTAGDQTSTVGVGTMVLIPRNTEHHFRNVGDTTARILDWSLPDGQDRYFKAICDLAAGDGFNCAQVMEMGEPLDAYFPAVH